MSHLIIANGPFLDATLIHVLAKKSQRLIALDGAVDRLFALGIIPQVILGDFDGLPIPSAAYWGVKQTLADYDHKNRVAMQPSYVGRHDVEIVLTTDQYATDLEKGIQYADLDAAKKIIILCATDGRTDHTLGNFSLLRRVYQKKRPIYIYTNTEVLEYVKDDVVLIRGEVGDQCAVCAAPYATVTSSGLVFDMENLPLEYGVQESTCNQLATPLARIEVKGEALIMHPPRLSAQRDFLRLSRTEQLQKLLQQELTTEEMLKMRKQANALYYFFFDMDGVLTDTEIINIKAVIKALTFIKEKYALHFEIPDSHAFFADFLVGNTLYQMHEEINSRFQDVVTFQQEFEAHASKFFMEMKNSADFFIPSSLVFLNKVQKKYPLCVVSNGQRDDIAFNIAKMHLDFPLLYIGAEDCRHHKPNPEPYLRAAKMLNVPPGKNCIAIEDSIRGVTAAKAAGMTVIGFDNHLNGRELLYAAGADRVVADLNELDVFYL